MVIANYVWVRVINSYIRLTAATIDNREFVSTAVAHGCIPVTITLFVYFFFFYDRDVIVVDFCHALPRHPLRNHGYAIGRDVNPILHCRPKLLQSLRQPCRGIR